MPTRVAQKHSSAALNAFVGIQGSPGPAFNGDPLSTRRMLLIGATGQNVCVFLWTNPLTTAPNTAAKTPIQPCRAMWLTLPPATPPTASQYGVASRLLLLLLLHLARPRLQLPPPRSAPANAALRTRHWASSARPLDPDPASFSTRLCSAPLHRMVSTFSRV